MTSEKENMRRSSRNLALSTFVSRFLGFFREILTADIIGGGLLMSAWVLASTFANMCRRILGEGALGTALIPIISHALEMEDQESVRRKFSTVFIWLTFLLALITLLIAVPPWLIAPYVKSDMWRLAFQLTPIVMPYTIFICMVGIMTSYANCLREFFLPSLTAILQNIVLIAALFFICPRYEGDAKVGVLAYAVLIAGIFEFLLMLAIIYWKKMYIRINRSVFTDFATIGDVWKLAVYGVIGASVLQVSLLTDRTIASFISDYAPAALYNSDRLIYLPIGIFAIAFGTVSLPAMSRAAARSAYAEMTDMMFFSLKNLLFITFPIAVFMFSFGEPLIKLCFYRGAFDDIALQATSYAFVFYAVGIPSFAAMKVTLMGFYARKDMKTPLKVSVCCIILNIALSLIFMIPLGVGGIALATVIASLCNNITLLILLDRQLGGVPFKSIGIFCLKLLAVSVLAVLPALLCFYGIAPWADSLESGTLNGVTKKLIDFGIRLIPLSAAGIVFGVLFLIFGLIFRLEETKSFMMHFLLRKREKEV